MLPKHYTLHGTHVLIVSHSEWCRFEGARCIDLRRNNFLFSQVDVAQQHNLHFIVVVDTDRQTAREVIDCYMEKEQFRSKFLFGEQ